MREIPRFAAVLVAIALAGVAGLIALRPSSHASPHTALPVASKASTAKTGSLRSAPSSSMVTTQSLDKAVEWYRDHLQFREISQHVDVQGRSAVLERHGALLEIREDEHAGEGISVDGSQASQAISFTLMVDDVDQETQHLVTSGVEVLIGPRDRLDSHFRGALIRDLDGHIIRLREPIEE